MIVEYISKNNTFTAQVVLDRQSLLEIKPMSPEIHSSFLLL